MKRQIILIALLLAPGISAQATVFTERDAFEAAIDIIYTETFESLAGRSAG